MPKQSSSPLMSFNSISSIQLQSFKGILVEANYREKEKDKDGFPTNSQHIANFLSQSVTFRETK